MEYIHQSSMLEKKISWLKMNPIKMVHHLVHSNINWTCGVSCNSYVDQFKLTQKYLLKLCCLKQESIPLTV